MHHARILHTMLRVGDLERSIDFYARILGMKVLRTLDQPDEKYKLVFIGYEDERSSAVIELTYNYGITEYEMGSAYGHIAIAVRDIYEACLEIRDLGGTIILEPMPLNGSDEIIAFVTDPDGYKIELIEREESWFG